MPARVRLCTAALGWWIQHRLPEVRRGLRLERDGEPGFPGWVQPQFACSRQAQISRGPKTSGSRQTAVGASQPAVHVTIAPNASISKRCAAHPKPLRPCSRVLTLKYPIAADIVRPSLDWRHDRTAPNFGHVLPADRCLLLSTRTERHGDGIFRSVSLAATAWAEIGLPYGPGLPAPSRVAAHPPGG